MKKTIKSILLISLVGLFHTNSFSQQYKVDIDESKSEGGAVRSELLTSECVGKINSKSSDLKWMPALTHTVRKIEHSLPGKVQLDSLKAIKQLNKSALGERADGGGTSTVEDPFSTPEVGEGFVGNLTNGSSPMDNSIAISDAGIIVSVANTTIQYKDMDGTSIYYNTILGFINDVSISNVCDPVVIYDPQEDRFIFFAQECSGNSANSHLLIMFSQTNDPTDGWNYYKLTGNPLSDNSWFDYPKLAVSGEDLFITGNLFYNSGYYNQPVIYQMEKNGGFSGESLSWRYWSGIAGSPGTLLPVSSGTDTNYGPGIYLVSTKPYSGNRIKFYDLTDDVTGDPSINYYSISTPYYDVAADSDQLGSSCKLDNGDCRVLSGFYMNGIVHFVFQSDVGSSWNGINYNRLDVADLSNTSKKFGNAGTLDYSYPSIAYFGFGPEDHSVMIGFGSVSSSQYPDMRAVHCNNDMDFSSVTQVFEGFSYACFTSTSKERWGDYTGMARKHNSETPSVWVNGMYGTASHAWNTWIAEIHADYTSGIEEIEVENTNIEISPNPIVEAFVVAFEIKQDVNVNVQIIGLDGRIVKDLYTGTAYAGMNKFSFNKSNLASGTYILQIKSDDKTISNEKIIVQ